MSAAESIAAGGVGAKEGRVARRRAKVRQRILDIAEKLMVRRGVDGVTIDDIADAADIARRSFYHHFESKNEMLVPIARARTKTLNRRIDRLVSSIDDPAAVVATGIRHGLREIPADPLCSWFVLHSGLAHERLHEGMGESGTRDVLRAVQAGRFQADNLPMVHLLAASAFISILGAKVEGRLDNTDLDDAVEYLLRMFGMDAGEAHDIAHRPLRPLPPDPGENENQGRERNARRTN